MEIALALAKAAESIDEVPIGAIIVKDGKVISTGFNTRETLNKTFGHAEIEAIKKANKVLQSWRLIDCELFVTIEPCIMCSATIQQARFKRVIFGAKDKKGGGLESLYRIAEDARLNHSFEVTSGVLEERCSDIMKSYFKNKRKNAKKLR